MSTCCTCGFKWRTGTHGGHSCAEQMGKTIDAQAAEIERLREALAYAQAGFAKAHDAASKGLTDECLLHCGHHESSARAALEQTK